MSSYLDSLFGLGGKTALITGATRGIGKSIAVALATAGADVILVQRNLTDTETRDVVRGLGRKAEIVLCDLANASAVKGLIKKVTRRTSDGGLDMALDILINCGGIQRRMQAENFSDQDWDDVLQVNLHSCFILSRDAGRHMLETRGGVSGEGGHVQHGTSEWKSRSRGKIINVGSFYPIKEASRFRHMRRPRQAYVTATFCPYIDLITLWKLLQHGILGMTKALSNEPSFAFPDFVFVTESQHMQLSNTGSARDINDALSSFLNR
ncbi:MAG: hypothetical protein CYPHOPRED_004563 [Cyphobasidiales sp. Tagirdzhanova-0007]|nr:MAG: hypothetical protein CYPHOPRED_004563 [Cyphobasidiales sp. Tagirdzhanova-0007]